MFNSNPQSQDRTIDEKCRKHSNALKMYAIRGMAAIRQKKLHISKIRIDRLYWCKEKHCELN